VQRPRGRATASAAATIVLAVAAATVVLGALWLRAGRSPPLLSGLSSGAGPADALSVVGLGDSVPAGAACGCANYVTLVGQDLAARTGRDLTVTDLGADGFTTDDVLDQLGTASARDVLADADVVVVTVGANDLDRTRIATPTCPAARTTSCFADDVAGLQRRVTGLLSQVRGLQSSHGGQLLVTGYWNVFLDGAVGRQQGPDYVAASDALTRAVDAAIVAATAATGTSYVDVYRAFKGDGSIDCTPLLAADGDHPNADGHQVIARAVEQQVHLGR
jgi:lysophospholipase L1-like esterase